MPTARIDLTAPDFVAEPYPFFAAERQRHAVAWHERSSRWLTFDHACANPVLRDRRLGRLRRLVAGAFARGHVERLRPRVREWSQAIVKMYEVSPSRESEDAAIDAAEQFAATIRDIAQARAASPEQDLIFDLVAAREGSARLSEDEVVASAVLLLNAGHEASVNVIGKGPVSMLQRGLAPKPGQVAPCVEEMLRFDSALQLLNAPRPRMCPSVTSPCGRARRSRLRGLHLVGDPVSRGTFVLRGYTSVRVGA